MLHGRQIGKHPVEKELIINSTPTDVEIALMEDSKLVEIHYQKTNTNFTVGDIFLGRIRKLMPGLNAAFVDIGHKKDAFFALYRPGTKTEVTFKIFRKNDLRGNDQPQPGQF